MESQIEMKKNYTSPLVQSIIIDSEISIIMMSTPVEEPWTKIKNENISNNEDHFLM